MKKIILILLIIAVVLMVGCKKEIEQPEEIPPEVVEEPTIPVEEQAPLEQKTELEMVTEATCFDNKISLTITNPTSESLIIGKTAKVLLNGIVMVDSECDKYTLESGESVFCEDISGHYATRKGVKNTIQINMKAERSIVVVDCAE